MSRLASFSPAALRAMFSIDSEDTLLALLTLSGTGVASPVRFTDGFTHRFEWLTDSSMTATDLANDATAEYVYSSSDAVLKDTMNYDRNGAVYGTVSAGKAFLFVPFNLTLPTEDQASAPRCSITINDVTQLVIPIIRSLTTSPSVGIDLILNSTPDNVEASFPGFVMGSVSYNSGTVTAELTVESLATEPFPCHTFTPSSFPGLF